MIPVPESNVTNHSISAHGSKGNSGQTEFTSIDKAAPLEAPLLLSPQDRTTFNIFNSAGQVIAGAFKYLFGVFAHIGGSSPKSQGISAVFDWDNADGIEDASYILLSEPGL